MLLMGDEYGHTRKGNNNPYPQDNEINWFLWNEWEDNQDLFRFVSFLIQFRKDHAHFKKKHFLSESDVQWHGKEPFSPQWKDPSPFLGCTLFDQHSLPVLIYFNATKEVIPATLPPSPKGTAWHLIVDTFAEAPHDFRTKEQELRIDQDVYQFSSYSSAVFKAV